RGGRRCRSCGAEPSILRAPRRTGGPRAIAGRPGRGGTIPNSSGPAPGKCHARGPFRRICSTVVGVKCWTSSSANPRQGFPLNLPRNPAARRLQAVLLSSLSLLALAPASSRATDIAHASVPSLVKDNKISIGSHAFRLPPGQWMLVQGQTFTTASAGNHDAEIFRGVVVLL